MSNHQFEKLVILLNDSSFASVQQGLMLWETLLDVRNAFFLEKFNEIDFTKVKETFTYGFGEKQYPSWLRKAKFRLYVALWALGYLAKNKNEMALSVQKVELNDPAFSVLPETFIHLSGLTHFELQRSQWTELEDIWNHFPKLTSLNLFDNEITTLPPSLGLCTQLQKIDLSYNPIKTLPDCIRTMVSLQHLEIRSFKGSVLPKWFGELQELLVLNAESADLMKLPTSIGNLKKLHTLKLRWSKLKTIPETIGGCTALKSMDIASTDITIFPPTLPVLQAWESQLKTSWDSLQHLSKLHTMEIWIEDLNKEIDFSWFPSLRSLTINSGHCSFKNITQCTNLKKIDVSRDQTSIPDVLCQMESIQELVLSYSKITSFPDNIGNITSLRKIELSSLELSEKELLKLRPLLPEIVGTKKKYRSSKREIRWNLEVEAYQNAKAIETFRQRLLMRDFPTIPQTKKIEQLDGFLDSQTPCADISAANELLLFTIHAADPVPPSWLENLSPSPKLQTVQFKCTFTEFPKKTMRGLLGIPSISQTGSLTFDIDVKVPKEYELDLWETKLQIAQEQGLLSQITCFTSKLLTKIPALLEAAESLHTLECNQTLCVDFPETVLKLPNLMIIEGKGEEKPNSWPVRTVTFQTIEAFLANAPQYDNIRTLYLKGAWLSSIPEAVLNMRTLRILDLSWNRLRHLDYDVSRWSDLKRLILFGNAIEKIPEQVLTLPSLEEIMLPDSFTDQLDDLQKKANRTYTLFQS